ncbi:ABC transporter permease [Brachybacterium subflavum]|uniref:ABC transporter permease n=1 Tax=Brachybacterium subflavum TaxID=2585206 RepID=UPI00126607BD|nr:ABC transporter permease [Brachybacterium subflavum]
MTSPVAALSRVEALLLLRSPSALFTGILLPSVLLLVQGFVVPGLREPLQNGATGEGLRGIDLLSPLSLLVTISSVALISFPVAIAGYRETGFLRSLRAAPTGATQLLLAQVLVNAATIVAGAGLALLLSVAVLGVRMPASPLALAVVAVLAVCSMFAIGSVIAGLASTSRAANGIGVLTLFTCLLAGGIWTPGPLMPPWAQTLAALSPFGAASQAITSAWLDGRLDWMLVFVLVAWTAGIGIVAVRAFRWR